MKSQNTVIAVGRVMTCVQGMVVKREREIRDFVKTPFYKINAVFSDKDSGDEPISYIGEWKVTSSSKYYGAPNLYKENGFLKNGIKIGLLGVLLQNFLLLKKQTSIVI